MARIVASVERDPSFAAVGATAVTARRSGSRLAFFVRDDAGSLASAALNQALIKATSSAVPASELDTTHWSAAELASWQREYNADRPQSAQGNLAPGEFDAR